MKGLTEQELECLLGDVDTKTPIPKLHLAMVRRTLKPFLRKISGMCKVECITFFHHAIGWVRYFIEIFVIFFWSDLMDF